MIIGKLAMMSSLLGRSLPSSCSASIVRSSGASRHNLMVSAFLNDDAKVKVPKAKVSKKKTGDEIKRAPSALNLYIKSALPAIKANLPEGSSTKGLFGLGYEQWKALSPEGKEPFEAASKALKEAVAQQRAEKKAARRPPSPFAAFVKSSYPGFGAQNPGVPASAVMSNIAAAWKAVSSEEKASMASEYKTQLEAWKAKTVEPKS